MDDKGTPGTCAWNGQLLSQPWLSGVTFYRVKGSWDRKEPTEIISSGFLPFDRTALCRTVAGKEIEPNLLLYVILVIVSLLSIRLRNGFDESETYKGRESINDWVSATLPGQTYPCIISFLHIDGLPWVQSMKVGNSEIRDIHSTLYGHLISRRKKGK